MRERMTVALAGNPNSGKTTIFNSLTGTRQHVGNYPGVTVEKKEGYRTHGNAELHIVDLPGTYSLTAYSAEELIARNFVVDENPDVVVDIVDSSNLERNLYLAVQILELGAPLILAFNMSDVAKRRGLEFDTQKLSELLGAPIVHTVGHKGVGSEDLLDRIVAVDTHEPEHRPKIMHYGREIDEELEKIRTLIHAEETIPERYDSRWIALKLLESDDEVRSKIHSTKVLSQVDASIRHLEGIFGDGLEVVIPERRYAFISGACQEAVRSTVETRHTASDMIDSVVTSRLLGIPIFLGLMYLVFHLTFSFGEPVMGWLEHLFGWLAETVSGLWQEESISPLKGLLVDGIIGGVGGVVVFLPNLLLLFLAIAVLEDSGYMARAAFIMDRLMHKIGLHGKSFIPMLIGFGCTVPAIMATRTLENRRDRLATIMVLPLMSCGARLPIYALIIPAFFPPKWNAPMLWIVYLIGVILAVLFTRLLRSTVLKGDAPPFVMELPPYRVPTVKGVVIHVWERAWLFLKKAGTVILGISVLLWILTNYPKAPEAELAGLPGEEARAEADRSYSMAGRVGHALGPVLKPLGFNENLATPLIGALAAKEIFVAQLGIVYSMGETDEESETLRDRLRADYNPLQAFCIMLFTLVSAPCIATLAIARRETNSWKWALLQFGGLTALAYALTAIVYQAGSLLGLGTG